MDSLRRNIGKCSMAILVAAASTGMIGHLLGQGKPIAELHPPNSVPISIRIVNQTPRTIYETITKVAGINVVFDQKENQQSESARFTVDLSKVTLREALDKVASVTKTSWAPTSDTVIAVTL